MRKFVVAFLSFHDNELEQEVCTAEDAITACVSVMSRKGWEDVPLFDTMEDLKVWCFEGDCMIGAIEVSERT